MFTFESIKIFKIELLNWMNKKAFQSKTNRLLAHRYRERFLSHNPKGLVAPGRQTENITFPHTSYAGGNKYLSFCKIKICRISTVLTPSTIYVVIGISKKVYGSISPWSLLLCSTDCASQACIEQEVSELNFVSCTTQHFKLWAFLESIEHDFIKTLNIQTDNQMLT